MHISSLHIFFHPSIFSFEIFLILLHFHFDRFECLVREAVKGKTHWKMIMKIYSDENKCTQLKKKNDAFRSKFWARKNQNNICNGNQASRQLNLQWKICQLLCMRRKEREQNTTNWERKSQPFHQFAPS